MNSSSDRSRFDSESWQQLLVYFFRIDPPLLLALLVLAMVGLLPLYSAAGGDLDVVWRQLTRLGLAGVVMLVVAQINPARLRLWSPWLYGAGIAMLAAVLIAGEIGKGAQRWLDLGLFRFQPSELLKLGVPMMMAWYFSEKSPPPSLLQVGMAGLLVVVPCVLIALQPDLGTALLVASAGVFALFLAGLGWRLIFALAALAAALAPVLWHFMHDYQRRRVLTFINPENDPLGAGYHIIQSKIAVGSGGIYGKGWLNGTQSKLEFLPESSTDFIFAVFGEEFGLVGGWLLLLLYLLVIWRGLYIAANAQDSYARILAGSLSLTFFVYLFVNIGMVTGLLPVVGVPLPLVSYGGTSMVTLMAGFGILMAVSSHRNLLKK